MNLRRVRQNYWAILVAAIACFLLEAVWYSLFLNVWLSGIGRSIQTLADAGRSAGMAEWMQYLVAFASAALIAAAISCVTQLTGAQTALRGIRSGVLLWLGFVATTWATEYVFEIRPVSLFAVNAGFWLLGMILMGAIVGGWKKKSAVASSTGQQLQSVGS